MISQRGNRGLPYYGSITLLGEHLKQSLPVRIVGKDVFSPIPTRGEMVDRAGKLEAKGPGHTDQDTWKAR